MGSYRDDVVGEERGGVRGRWKGEGGASGHHRRGRGGDGGDVGGGAGADGGEGARDGYVGEGEGEGNVTGGLGVGRDVGCLGGHRSQEWEREWNPEEAGAEGGEAPKPPDLPGRTAVAQAF